MNLSSTIFSQTVVEKTLQLYVIFPTVAIDVSTETKLLHQESKTIVTEIGKEGKVLMAKTLQVISIQYYSVEMLFDHKVVV
jgi:hypothetical protein